MKRQVAIVAVLSILLASCGGSGWSCKKSYCEAQKNKIDITKKEVMFPERIELVCP